MNHSPAMRKLLCFQMHVFVQKKKRNHSDTSRLLQTIWWAIVTTALAKLQRGGALRRRDCRSWPSFFPCLIRNLCTSALPPPKPKPLLLQACEGGSAWSEVSGSLPQQALCVCCLERCVFLLGFFFFFFKGLSSCVIGRAGNAALAPSAGSPCRMADEGPKGFSNVCQRGGSALQRDCPNTKQRLYEFLELKEQYTLNSSVRCSDRLVGWRNG